MKNPMRITLAVFSIALLFEACTIKKAEVGSQEEGETNLALAEETTPIPSTLHDRLYPKGMAAPSLEKKSLTLEQNYKAEPSKTESSMPMNIQPSIAQVIPAPKRSAQAGTNSYRQYRNKESRLDRALSPREASSEKMYRAEYDGIDERGCFPGYSQPANPNQNSEEYASLPENAFMDARSNPLSTFSIDVDGASYSNTRRFIQEGQLPPSEAIRIEEFINYFSYDYPEPTGSDPFSIITEVATTPWNPATKLVHIGLQGRRSETENLPPSNLVFLIDVSGSMASEDKLPLLKNGFDLLVDQLRPQDRISIVVYAGAAGMVLPPTSGAEKDAIREALLRLDAGGSTAGGAGIMLAYQAAKSSFIKGGNNRVILATDGDFNVGISDDHELVRLIEEKRKSGVFLSVLGFGTGNIKDAKMEQLADKGNGNYFYIDNINEARKVLVEKMAGTLYAIAKDVKLQIEFNPALVKSYRLVGYENRVLAAEDFNDDKKDAGELGSGTNVTALYEIIPVHAPRPKVDPLKYQDNGTRSRWNWGFGFSEPSGEILTVKFRYKQPTGSTSKLLSRTLVDKNQAWQDASQNFRFSAAVAGFALVLKHSNYGGNLDLDKVAAMGRGAKGRDRDGHRTEFLNLVEMAKSLSSYSRLD